jgi:probable selenate reductase molybdenum-binding subunit
MKSKKNYDIKDVKNFKVVNHSVNKVDGYSLATGKAKYVDDFIMPNMLYAKILTSPHAHAKIVNIDISEAEKLEGVHAVICHTNVPRVLRTTAGQGYPEPSPYDTPMFDNKVRFVGDRVAAVAAETLAIAEEALKKIKVEYEVLKPILDPKDAMKKNAPIIHDEKDAHVIIPIAYDPKKNLSASVDAVVGNLKKACDEADVVIEREYESHYAQHCPIEPHITSGYLDENDRLTIITSTQVPFHARRITAQTLQIPIKKIRVIKPRIGGGFGTKQEVLLEDVVGKLVLLTRRPVKLEYTREEEFVSGRTRHPQNVKITLAANKDGQIKGIGMDVLSNTGAYGSHALTVVCNCGSKVLPLYPCDHVAFHGRTVYTNMPVGGAYRGYGATQAAFAMECVIDEMARKLNIDPIEFRKQNAITEGKGSPIFKALGEGKEGVEMTIKSCGIEKCLDIGAKEIGWGKKKKASSKYKKRGQGMCLLMQGSSVPEIDMGACHIKMNEDGSFNMQVGATDIGTGSDTVLAQIAAEVLETETSDFIVYSSDTDLTPFDVGAYASSTTYLSGYAALDCAKKVKEQIIEIAAEMMNTTKDKIFLEDKKAWTKDKKDSRTYSEIALYSLYEHNQFQIAAVNSHITHDSPPPFSAHFVDVEIDTNTGELEIKKYVATVDCGTAINPQLAEGQVEGAVLNGISFALTEEYIFDEKGKMLNSNFKNYKIFSTSDITDIKCILVPTYEPTGPFGAKSVSEIGINGALPAFSNAIYDAIGVRLTKAPFTSERILKALKEKK